MKKIKQNIKSDEKVTILILIDGFLQSDNEYGIYEPLTRHNPYFNRWFSAIYLVIIFQIH